MVLEFISRLSEGKVDPRRGMGEEDCSGPNPESRGRNRRVLSLVGVGQSRRWCTRPTSVTTTTTTTIYVSSVEIPLERHGPSEIRFVKYI